MKQTEEYSQEMDAPASATKHPRIKTKQHRRIWAVLTGLVALFVCFVLLVNFCMPVAYACSKVPILRELAEAVKFSRSLTDAVAHEYVQPLDLQQTDHGVTAKVEYLIVDQKQVNVFFRLESNTYENMYAAPPTVCQRNGAEQTGYSSHISHFGDSNGQLQSMTIDFHELDVPDSLWLRLQIANEDDQQSEEPAEYVSREDLLLYDSVEEPVYVAEFDFLLEFDPTFTAQGKNMDMNQTVTLGDQQIKLTNMEIYPTHLRLNVEDVPGNTAWLKGLNFYMETEDGTQFDTICNGITATGTQDSPMRVSYRADSPYFYEADHLKIVITGAEWLNKDTETIHLNLETGEADRMPDGTEIYDIIQKDNSWIITVRAKQRDGKTEEAFCCYQVFNQIYYDPDGKEGYIDHWCSDPCSREKGEAYFDETFPLKNYLYHEVWLSPSFSHVWVAAEPVVVLVS